MAKKEVWEIDVESITINDLVELEEARTGGMTMRQMRDLLARFVSNKTSEELGELPITQLAAELGRVANVLNEAMGLPKQSDTPS